MANSKPLILLSNDDGYQAKGINELIKALRDEADLVVVAPDGPRSGASGAITSGVPVHYEMVSEEEGLVVYKCSGTPVDCTKLALHAIVGRTPDLIIGGINQNFCSLENTDNMSKTKNAMIVFAKLKIAGDHPNTLVKRDKYVGYIIK